MTVVTPSDGIETLPGHVQLTLTWPEVERLRTTLPWLLRALADRPTVPPRQRERRLKAQTALEQLLSQIQRAKQDADRSSGDFSG